MGCWFCGAERLDAPPFSEFGDFKNRHHYPRWLKAVAEAEGVNCPRLLEAAPKEQLGIAS